MNRVLKVLIGALIVFLAYMWVSILYKSCSSNSGDFDSFPEEGTGTDTEVPTINDELKDETFFADEEGEEATEDPIDYDKLDQDIETATPKAAPVAEEDPREVVSAPEETTTASANVGGPYMVIAGNYLLEENANDMVKKLKKIGYSSAEKVVFDLSQFHSVCAGRFNDSGSAQRLSEKLKSRGIESYVHRRK